MKRADVGNQDRAGDDLAEYYSGMFEEVEVGSDVVCRELELLGMLDEVTFDPEVQ